MKTHEIFFSNAYKKTLIHPSALKPILRLLVSFFVFVFVACVTPTPLPEDGPENGNEEEVGPLLCGAAVWTVSNPLLVEEATQADLDATPRGSVLEYIALSVSGGFVADDAVYERVVSDVNAIWQKQPDLADIYMPVQWENFNLLDLGFDEAAWEAFLAGEYHGLDELEAIYGHHSISIGSDGWVTLSFYGFYDVAQLVPIYERAEGIVWAEISQFGGEAGPHLCSRFEGEKTTYVFSRGWQDCPAGCVYHQYTVYECLPGERPRLVGEIDNSISEEKPDWLVSRPDCSPSAIPRDEIY